MDKIKVLIVEDSPTVQLVLTSILEEDEEIVVVGKARNGAEAVSMSEKLRPDLITMDIEMPDMDGLEATRRIMAQRPTPILIITAYAGSPRLNLAFESMKAGALDLLPKPPGLGSEVSKAWEKELVEKVKILSRALPRSIE